MSDELTRVEQETLLMLHRLGFIETHPDEVASADAPNELYDD